MSKEKSKLEKAIEENDFFPADNNPTSRSPEERLWRAVVLQAFIDLAGNTYTEKTIHIKHRATHWLTTPSRDLFNVCDMADMQPQTIMARARRARDENGLNWRLPPRQSPHYELRKKYRLKVHHLTRRTAGIDYSGV